MWPLINSSVEYKLKYKIVGLVFCCLTHTFSPSNLPLVKDWWHNAFTFKFTSCTRIWSHDTALWFLSLRTLPPSKMFIKFNELKYPWFMNLWTHLGGSWSSGPFWLHPHRRACQRRILRTVQQALSQHGPQSGRSTAATVVGAYHVYLQYNYEVPDHACCAWFNSWR